MIIRLSARLLSGAARSSDQSVYNTDTDVPSIDEPSVPVKDVNLDCVGSQVCVVSESGGLSEAGPSEVVYVTSGDSLEQLASSILSKMNELQSDRGRLPHYRVIPLWVVVVGLLLPLPII